MGTIAAISLLHGYFTGAELTRFKTFPFVLSMCAIGILGDLFVYSAVHFIVGSVQQ